MTPVHPMFLAYRTWLLADAKNQRYYSGPPVWRAKVTMPGSCQQFRFVGARIIQEINGRPIAEGADRDE